MWDGVVDTKMAVKSTMIQSGSTVSIRRERGRMLDEN